MFGGAISVMHTGSHVTIEVNYYYNYYYFLFITIIQWTADATNDMYADAVLSVILQVSSQPKRFGGTCNTDCIHLWVPVILIVSIHGYL